MTCPAARRRAAPRSPDVPPHPPHGPRRALPTSGRVSGTPRREARRTDLALALALALGATALYATPSLRSGFLYDDHEVILGAPPPRSVTELGRVFLEPHFRGLPYYRPVVRATLLGQRMLHGDVPAPFHAVNAALAGAVACLAFALLRLPAFGVRPAPAALAAALFVAHPIASSVVYPIASGRETLLPAVLALASTAAFLRGGAAFRAASALLFAAALLGKEASVVLPALFALADALRLTPDPPGRAPRGWLVRYAPFVAVLAGYAVVRSALFGGSELRVALLDDPLGPLRSVAFAVQTAFAPRAELAYEPELSVWWSPPRLLLAFAAVAGLKLGVWRAGEPTLRRAVWWSGWFVLSLLPTANLLHQEAPFDERYTFLAWLALPAVAALLASTQWERAAVRQGVSLAAGLAIAACAFLSVERAGAFRDDAAFAAQWLRTNPASPEAHHLLGLLALRDGRYEEAVAPLREAARLAPDSPEVRHNLGSALLGSGKTVGARLEFEAVLRLAPGHPEAENNLGLLSAQEGRPAEAEAHYRAALRAAPDFVEARSNLGAALARRGDLSGAEAELRRALELAPDFEDARRNLDAVLARRR